MKRIALITAAAVALPLTGAVVASAQAAPVAAETGYGVEKRVYTPRDITRPVVLQAGSTRRVNLGTVNAGTGHGWRWITKPDAGIAKGLAVKTTKAARPGGPTVAFTRILGLAEDQRTTGKLGLYGPGATRPSSTITLKITVTGDGR